MNTHWLTSCTCVILIELLLFTPQRAAAQGPPLDPYGRTATDRPQEDSAKWNIKDQRAAIGQARRILDLPGNPSLPARAEVITVIQDNTPYLSEQVVSRPIWHVIIEKCRIVLPSEVNPVEDSYERTFDVLIDPRNGALLRISSRLPDGATPLPREASATVATEQLMNRGSERYHSFVPETPVMSFYEALVALVHDGNQPLEAEQMVGQYIAWSMLGQKPKAAWAVTLNRITPFESAYPGIPVEARNHMRYIVDPDTGRLVCGTTTPQPEIKTHRYEERRDTPEGE